MGQKYLEAPGGFADTAPIRAGETGYQVMFAFDMPYTDSASFSQPLNYNVNSSIILLPDNGVTLKSDTLTAGAAQAIQGASYNVYNGETMSKGSQLTIVLSGKPSEAAGAAGSTALAAGEAQSSLLIGLAALGLVLIFAGVWLWRRERSKDADIEEDEDEDEEESADDLDDTDSLMDAIIALDDQYKSGQISQEAYQQRRAELKSRLRQTMN